MSAIDSITMNLICERESGYVGQQKASGILEKRE